MKKELQRIANTLLLYSYHIQAPGLFNGKMGIILYLYQYSRYSGCKYYSDFADDLLDTVLNSVNHSSLDFESGISGIGWGINYLIKNKYVDGDPNDVLLDVDKRVFFQLNCNPNTSILGQGVYLLERLKNNKSSKEQEKHIDQLLDFCNKGISEYKGSTSLYHLNSILYFLIEIDHMDDYREKADQTKKLLPNVIDKIFKDKKYDQVDTHIFNSLLNKLTPQQTKLWDSIILFKSDEIIGDLDIKLIMKLSFLESLYFGNNGVKQISPIDVRHFVNLKQESLERNDFFFCKGLAGLGSAILGM